MVYLYTVLQVRLYTNSLAKDYRQTKLHGEEVMVWLKEVTRENAAVLKVASTPTAAGFYARYMEGEDLWFLYDGSKDRL